MLHMDWVEDPRIFTDLNDEWESLLAGRAYRPPFLRPLWMRIWWEHHRGEYDLRILRVRDRDGRLAGLAPLCKKRHPSGPLEWIGGVDTSDVLDFIIRPGMEPQVLEAMSLGLHAAVNQNGGLDLHFIPDGSPTLASDHKIFKDGWDFTIEKEETSPWAPLKETFDGYLTQLRGKDRHEVRRKINKLNSNLNPALRILKNEDELDEAIGAFFHLHKMSHPEKSEFMTRDMERFFRDIAEAFLKDGTLRLAWLETDGKTIASTISFVGGRTWALYNSGYDPDYREFSPGIVLVANTIQQAIDEGLETYDFLRGPEDYKYRLGARDKDLFHIQVQPRAKEESR